jgi:DNA-binding XRE family transcriptional regulator
MIVSSNQERSDYMPRISLEAVRVNAKMTQKEWAEKLGVSNTTVVNWEKGNTEPSLSQLREMSRLSGVPMDFIFVPDKFN